MKHILTLIAILLLVGGCGGSITTTTADAEPAATVATPATIATPATLAETELSPSEEIAAAVAATSAELGYAFTVDVTIDAVGTSTDAHLSGWVDGADRQLTLTVDDAVVTTTVISGVAVVERSGSSVEIPLTEADAAPSLELLLDASHIEKVDATSYRGTLDAAAVADLVAGPDGTLDEVLVTIYLTKDGYIAGYEIHDPQGRWTMTSAISDVGAAFSGT